MRVIFEAHSTLERDGATDFGELLELRTTVLRDNRSRDEDAIATLSDQIGLEREKQSQITGLKSQITQKEALIAGYVKSRDTLVTTGSAERVARLNALTEAADHARTQIRLWSQETQALRSLQNDVSDSGPFLHNDKATRPPEIYEGKITIHTGGPTKSYLMLPVMPS